MFVLAFAVLAVLVAFNGQSGVDSANIVNGSIQEEDLRTVDSAIDEECLTFEAAIGDFEWQTCGEGIFNDSRVLVYDVQKGSPGTLDVGDVVYITGFDNGADVAEVELADSSSAATMPGIGIMRSEATVSVSGEMVGFGRLINLNTSSYAEGDVLYVSEVAGELTDVAPIGAALVQKIAIVARSHVSDGRIGVVGAGRANALPNLADDNVWLGSAAGVPVESSLPDCDGNNWYRNQYDTGGNVWICDTDKIDVANDVTGILPILNGGTNSSTAGDARSALGVDAAGTDNSTNVTLAGALDYVTIIGQAITRNAVDLTTDTTGDLAVADGGTGESSFTDHGVMLGSGGGALSVTGTGVSGEVLTSNGSGDDPTFQSVSGLPFVSKNADEIVNNSDTLQNDNDLTFSVAANKNYAIWGVLIINSPSNADIKFQWGVPAAATADSLFSSAAGTVESVFESGSTNWGTTGNNQTLKIMGVAITSGTSGDIFLEWAQQTAQSSDTKILKGSWLAYKLLN